MNHNFSIKIPLLLCSLIAILLLGSPRLGKAAQVDNRRDPSNSITLVSADSNNTPANDFSLYAAISADAHYAAFNSAATNLAPFVSGNTQRTYLRDLTTNQTTLISAASDSTPADSSSIGGISFSQDGQYIAYVSLASNLVAGDTNAAFDVFVYNQNSAVTTRVSIHANGSQAFGSSYDAAISASGRYIAFDSEGALVNGDLNSKKDVFVHDRDSDGNGIFDEVGQTTTVLISVATDGTQANDHITPLNSLAISADGRYVTFASTADNLVADDNNTANCFTLSCSDIFVHDRDVDLDGIYDEVGAIRTVRVSVANDGTEGNNKSEQPRMSADGRFIVFQSDATNLVANDPLPCVCSNIFLHDRDSDQDGIFDEPGAITTERISQFAAQATRPRISADGQIITYLLEGDTDIPCLVTQGQIVRFDRSDNSTTCPIRNRTSGTPNGATSGAALSADGQAMVFHSSANNLVGGVTSSGHVYLYQHNGDSAQATVDTYTRVRDELFATSPTGVRYTQLFYQHTGEVVQLALADPAFFQSIRTTMTLWQPTLEALLDPGRAGDTVISAEQINALDTFLTTVSTRGSSELAATIAAERQALPPFNAFIGMTVADAAATVLDAPYQIYLPAIANSAPTRGATQIESPQRNDLCLFICIMLGFCE